MSAGNSCAIEETVAVETANFEEGLEPIVKKRGRKAKNPENDKLEMEEGQKKADPKEPKEPKEPKVAKKRGRKPKGGKIITNLNNTENIVVPEPNIIIHLKCGEADLVQNSFLNYATTHAPSVQPVSSYHFDQTKGFDLTCHTFNESSHNSATANLASENTSIYSIENNGMTLPETNYDAVKTVPDETKLLWKKIKELTINLHMNNISDKKSACFWCTCEFDNPPIFIPKHELNNTYFCYGCFCSPECATAHLFNEPIDTSTRFERYHLLNHIYCKIYDYTKNIKPAPNPHYLLAKYYGNLTIQEFRRLLKNERLLLIVDKPLSRTLPELHEDNDDFIFNGKIIPSANSIKLRRQNKTHTKTDIISEKFSCSK
jgi:hypothetical protein